MKEYDVYFIDDDHCSSEIADYLNFKATQGFEFIGRDNQGFLYFEREKKIEKKKTKRNGKITENC